MALATAGQGRMFLLGGEAGVGMCHQPGEAEAWAKRAAALAERLGYADLAPAGRRTAGAATMRELDAEFRSVVPASLHPMADRIRAQPGRFATGEAML